jgi:hypothetical protein
MEDILSLTRSDVDNIPREELLQYLTHGMKNNIKNKLSITSVTISRALSKSKKTHQGVNAALKAYIILNARAEIKRYLPEEDTYQPSTPMKKFNLTD